MYAPSFKNNAVGKGGANTLDQCRIAYKLPIREKQYLGKCNKVKYNKTRYAYRRIFNWEIAEMHTVVKNMKHK